MTAITPQLLARAAVRGEGATTTATLAVLGEAVDAGLIALDDLLALVRSCSTADELGDMLLMLAATVPAQPAGGA